jgi:hypothetical protein
MNETIVFDIDQTGSVSHAGCVVAHDNSFYRVSHRLIVVPNLVAQLLFSEYLAGAGLALARLAGVSLLALAVAAWRGRRELSRSPALAAMLIYNVPMAIYLAYLGVDGHFVGKLLWPAVAIHAAMGLLLARAWLSHRPIA